MILSSARREKGGRDHRHLDASASRRFTLIVVQMRTPVEGLLGGGKTWEQIDCFFCFFFKNPWREENFKAIQTDVGQKNKNKKTNKQKSQKWFFRRLEKKHQQAKKNSLVLKELNPNSSNSARQMETYRQTRAKIHSWTGWVILISFLPLLLPLPHHLSSRLESAGFACGGEVQTLPPF